ncbi:hypothetical protein WDW86_01035 [Bdellovibrionota bacterium FG-2]
MRAFVTLMAFTTLSVCALAGPTPNNTRFVGEGVCTFPRSKFIPLRVEVGKIIERNVVKHTLVFTDTAKKIQGRKSEVTANGETSQHQFTLDDGTYTVEVRVVPPTASGSIVGKFTRDQTCSGTFSAVAR